MSKRKTTHIICVLDRSGSMKSLEDEVINSFNDFVENQKKLEGKATLTLALFDHEYQIVYDQVPIKKIEPLTKDLYFARGMTALNDAIGNTIDKFKLKKNVIFFVQTDGQENASQKYTNDKIKKLTEKHEKRGWEFVFFGANVDAFAEGNMRGINNTINYKANSKGVVQTYLNINNLTTNYRNQ